jgi:polyhydroxybutyrate depolymerase
MRALVLGLVLMASSAVAGEDRSLSWQGIERQYRLHNQQPDAAPAVVYLHHRHSEAGAIEARANLSLLAWNRLDAVSRAEGFVTVTPAAIKGFWNHTPGLGDLVEHPEIGEVDDVGFVFALVDHLIAAGIAEPERVYVTGISNGAILSYRLLCTEGNPFAAAVPVVGNMPDYLLTSCADIPPTPVMLIAGTKDRIVPYDGWIYRHGRYISVPEVMEFWRQRQGCKEQRWKLFEDSVLEDNSRPVRVWWTGCDRDFAVELIRVEGGGHTTPSPKPVSEDWLKRAGGHNQDIDAAVLAWRFMQRFPEVPQPE